MAKDSFLYQALIGINEELDGKTWLQKVVAIAKHISRFLVEVMSLLTAIPYGIKTATLARSLPSLPHVPTPSSCPPTTTSSDAYNTSSTTSPHPPSAPPASLTPDSSSSYGVFVARGVRYGPADRQVLDAYVPVRPAKQPQQQHGQLSVGAGKSALAPVVLFTHGGVWASGDTWHYTWMATRLAQLGFVVLVHTYTLYPEALIPQMVEETSEAMSWAMDNVESLFSGDPTRISCVGHSAGAHLVSLALIHRAGAAARHQAEQSGQQQSRLEQQQQQQHEQQHHKSSPIHVQCSSTHTPQHSGSQSVNQITHSQCTDNNSGLEAQLQPSKSKIPANFRNDTTNRPSHPRIQISDPRMPARFVGVCGAYDIGQHYEYEKWRGVHLLSMMARAFGGSRFFNALSPAVLLEAYAQQEQEQHHHQPLQQQREGAASEHDRKQPPTGVHWHAVLEQAGLHGLNLAAHLDKTAWCVMGSEADYMVPHTNGQRMAENLSKCGVRVTQLLHRDVAHSQFVTLWPLLEDRAQLDMCCSLEPGCDERVSLGLSGLPPYARDLVQALRGS